MSDLYWERISAGHYETQYYSNGYKYKITGEGIEWQAHYMYRTKNPKLRYWRLLRFGASDRLKSAKILCAEHNANPRRRFIIKGRVEKEKYKNHAFVKYDALAFSEMIKSKDGVDGWVQRRYGEHFIDINEFYESYSSPATYLGPDYFDNEEIVERMAHEYSVAVENRSA